MAPISEPGPTPQLCPRCGTPLPAPKPPHCPHCGVFLRKRSVWLIIAAALGAVLLIAATFFLGAFAAIAALFASGESGNARVSGMQQAGAILIGAVLCAIAAIAIIVWLLKKPKPKR